MSRSFCPGQMQIHLVTIVFPRYTTNYTNTTHIRSLCYAMVITDVTTPIAKKKTRAPEQMHSLILAELLDSGVVIKRQIKFNSSS
jgi:hypothetical protein